MSETVGRFWIVRPLAEGRSGSIYLAVDSVTDQQIAIKKVRAGWNLDVVRARFVAGSAGRLTHPNLVEVIEVGEWQGEPFVAMAYVDGQPLSGLLRGAVEIPVARKMVVARGLCDGLVYLHERGVAHLDLDPGSVLVGARNTVTIIGAGLVSQSGSAARSPSGSRYIAPELETGAGDASADVFSAGALLYELFSGSLVPPVDASGSRPSLAVACPSLARVVSVAIDRALDVVPTRRPTSKALDDAFAGAVDESPVPVAPAQPARPIEFSTAAAIGDLAKGEAPAMGTVVYASQAVEDVRARELHVRARQLAAAGDPGAAIALLKRQKVDHPLLRELQQTLEREIDASARAATVVLSAPPKPAAPPAPPAASAPTPPVQPPPPPPPAPKPASPKPAEALVASASAPTVVYRPGDSPVPVAKPRAGIRPVWLLAGGVVALVALAAVVYPIVSGRLARGPEVTPSVSPPPSPTPPEPAVTAKGEVLFDILPWAEIERITRATNGSVVDAGALTTPVVVALDPGEYTVRVRNPHFGSAFEFTVTVASGVYQEVRRSLPAFNPDEEARKMRGGR